MAWWLHGRMPTWNPSVDTLQIQSPNQFDILLFLDEHFPKLYDAGGPTQPLLGFVIKPNDRHTVKWIRENTRSLLTCHRGASFDTSVQLTRAHFCISFVGESSGAT